MKINHKILHIPPYISTTWKNILSLHVERNTLVVILQSGTKVEIPSLEKPILKSIFDAHSKFLEKETEEQKTSQLDSNFPMKIGFGIESLGSAMQHNPEQADAPNLPPEILNKITAVARVLGPDQMENLPKPEPHCNCIYCQIARALQRRSEWDENFDEEVSDEDLTFKSWDVKQTSEKLYLVINPLDEKEQYSVFLGDPIGCTCGQKNCEHLRAVLKT